VTDRPDGPAADAGALLLRARTESGLTQVELARRAGVAQSVVSAYESGARQPSWPTLQRLIAATRCSLEVTVLPPARDASVLRGPLGERLRERRHDVIRIAGAHGLRGVRVFGSVARSEERPDSDIDLLVAVEPGTGLFALASAQQELESLLEAPVDLVPQADLKPAVARAVARDLVSL
jgi:hypothetical protein